MHVDYLELVNRIVENTWGREGNEEQLEKDLVSDMPRLTAFGIVELLKRMNAIAKAAGAGEDHENKTAISKYARDKAISLPDVKIGDVMYSGDIGDGVIRCVIISKCEDHRAMAVHLDDFDLENPPRAFLVDNHWHRTLSDAVLESANEDIEYHSSRLDAAKSARDKVNNGESLDEFLLN